MDTKHTAAHCRWAKPTLLLADPLWLGAWDAPWACVRDGEPRLLDSTEACAECPEWESPEKVAGHSADVAANPRGESP